jgi:hypothetical protein
MYRKWCRKARCLPKYAIYHDMHSIQTAEQIDEDPFLDNISHITEVNLPNEPLACQAEDDQCREEECPCPAGS